jgi:hypothetical protein
VGEVEVEVERRRWHVRGWIEEGSEEVAWSRGRR